MNITPHGGGCCGVKHLYGMNDLTATGANSLAGRVRAAPSCGILEVIVTDYQLRANDNMLIKQLNANKFRLVSRAYNPNSENHINIFHRTMTPKKSEGLETSPFSLYIEQQALAEAEKEKPTK